MASANYYDEVIDLNLRNNVFPPFKQFEGQTSYFPVGEARKLT